MESIVLENHIKLFVESKVGEEVTLNFRTDGVHVKPEVKLGSTTLGAFWVRVIQDFFPRDVYEYKRAYCKSTASHTLNMKFDDMTIAVHLRTGLLTVEGNGAYGWFKVKFPEIMRRYDEQTGTTRNDYLTDQIKFDQRRHSRKQSTTGALTPSPRSSPDRGRSSSSFLSGSLVESNAQMDEADTQDVESRLQFESLGYRPSKGPSSPSTKRLQVLMPGTTVLRDGPTVAYQTWKITLNKWLSSDLGCKVYVVTPAIDVCRLRDIVRMIFNNRQTASLEALVCNAFHKKASLGQVKADLVAGLYADQQLYVEYKIFNKIKLPQKALKAGLIACLHSDESSEVVTFSGEFTGDTFELPCTVAMSSIVCTKEDLYRDFLDPLADV